MTPEPEIVTATQAATVSKDDEWKIKEPSGKADFYGENEEIQEASFRQQIITAFQNSFRDIEEHHIHNYLCKRSKCNDICSADLNT